MVVSKARLVVSLVVVVLAGMGSGASALVRAIRHPGTDASARAALRSDIDRYNAILDCHDTSALDRVLRGYDRAIEDGDGRWLEVHTVGGSVRGACFADTHAWPELSLALQDAQTAQENVAEAADAVRSAWFDRADEARMAAAIAAFRTAEAGYDDAMDHLGDASDAVGHAIDVRIEAVLAADDARVSDYRLYLVIEASTAFGATLRRARRDRALDTATLDAQLEALRTAMAELPPGAASPTFQARARALETALLALKQADASQLPERFDAASIAFQELVEAVNVVTPRV